MKKTLLNVAVVMALGVAGLGAAQAAALAPGTKLVFDDGVTSSGTYISGTAFGMDAYGSGSYIWTAFAKGTDNGVIIGNAQATGPSVAGVVQNANGQLDAAWNFFGSWGHHFTNGPSATVGNMFDSGSCGGAVGSAASNALNAANCTGVTRLSDWFVNWNNVPAIDMGAGGNWGAGGAGITLKNEGVIEWTVTGNSFVLYYQAKVPSTSPAFPNTPYAVRMTGTIQAIPVPAAAWLFGSGLLGLVGIARRKKKVA